MRGAVIAILILMGTAMLLLTWPTKIQGRLAKAYCPPRSVPGPEPYTSTRPELQAKPQWAIEADRSRRQKAREALASGL